MPALPPLRSLPELTRRFAESQPEKTALVAGDRRLSYAELDAQSNRAAQALMAAGVEPGDRVAFLDKNVPEYFTLLFGAAKARAVSVAVNWRLAPPEMAFILDHARVKVLLIGREFLGHLDQMELASSPRVLVVEGAHGAREGFPEWVGSHEDVDPQLRATIGDRVTVLAEVRSPPISQLGGPTDEAPDLLVERSVAPASKAE